MDELKTLYEQDQADRHEGLMRKDLQLFLKRDSERLERALTLIKENKIITAADHLHAAMILQHGTEIKHFEMAHELAKKAAEMDYRPEKDEPNPLWLAAAAKDRVLVTQGRPQLYGTQFRKESKDGSWKLHDVDPTITDEERAHWHVPPLSEAYKRLEKLNRESSSG